MYNTERLANSRCMDMIDIDPNHTVYIGEVGKWCPLPEINREFKSIKLSSTDAVISGQEWVFVAFMMRRGATYIKVKVACSDSELSHWKGLLKDSDNASVEEMGRWIPVKI